MAIQGEIKTLYTDSSKERVLLPVTKTKAITDDQGVNLDELLASKASESFVTNKISEAQFINLTEQIATTISNLDVVYAYDEDPETTVAPVNADTLGGIPAADVAVKNDLTPENIGARPNTWTPTAEEVGAMPVINFNNTGCYYRYLGDVVEWINPPLALDVEYRTIERYKGLPVYIKACDLDLAPSGSKHVWIASGITNVVSIDGYTFSTEGSQLIMPLAKHAANMPMNIYGNLVFNVTANEIAHIIVKYTK